MWQHCRWVKGCFLSMFSNLVVWRVGSGDLGGLLSSHTQDTSNTDTCSSKRRSTLPPVITNHTAVTSLILYSSVLNRRILRFWSNFLSFFFGSWSHSKRHFTSHHSHTRRVESEIGYQNCKLWKLDLTCKNVVFSRSLQCSWSFSDSSN